MLLKDSLKKYLIGKAVAEYTAKVRSMTFHYEDYIEDFEKKRPAYSHGAQLIEIKYDELEEGYLREKVSRLSEDDILLFVSGTGRPLKNAKDFFLREFGEKPGTSLVYADEDSLSEHGIPEKAYFKPDWSPDTYRNSFYIGSIYAARASLVRKALDIRGEDIIFSDGTRVFPDGIDSFSAQDTLFARLAFAAGGFVRRSGMEFPVGHIAEVLFHRDFDADLFAGRCSHAEAPFVNFDVMVSIVIPSRDHPDVLGQCLDSIIRYGSGSDRVSYEIIVVDNGSNEENKRTVEELLRDIEIRAGDHSGLVRTEYVYEPCDFNFSHMCNLGASRAAGDLILFLNDDIEITSDRWLADMAAYAILPHVGTVGCKLLYPDSDLIQHAGITAIHIGPMHKFQRLSDDTVWYYGMNRGVHDMSGVTAACLMTVKSRFDEIGGYCEELAVAFNDVDLNWRFLEAGYYNVCCNYFALIHHESLSRGDDNVDVAKTRRLMKENDLLLDRHPHMYERDPFYNRHLEADDVAQDYLIANPREIQPDAIRAAVIKCEEKGYPDVRQDECVWFRTDYIGTLEEWNRLYYHGRKEKPVNTSGYYIKGYSFVTGSDNAIYRRRLVLRRVESATDLTPVDLAVYRCKVHDMLRHDVEQNLADQVHVAKTGYRVRIEAGALPPGVYQAGMLFIDKTSRTRVLNWGLKCFEVF